MEKNKNEYAAQVALFSSKNQKKLEDSLNGSLQEIATLGHKNPKIRFWTESRQWFGVLEYEMRLEELIGIPPDDEKEEIKILKNFRYNGNDSLLEIGYVGCKALVLQNGLDIDIKLNYSKVRELICDMTNLSDTTPVKELVVEVETVDVEIKV
tara:strand:+ start:1239 stop:1697 length:459 start_codon:yes stop_codon:yes gene_type:complete